MKKLFIFILISTILYTSELITPIPNEVEYNTNKAKLGEKLFHEKKLSSDNTISCSSCHIINNGGDDNRKFSRGINNKIGSMNAPTILNSRFNFAQFWDGRAKDLKEQALGPIHNPIEMGSNFKQIISKLALDKDYVKSFNEIYGGIDQSAILDAIVEFEKSLITPNSRFDKFLLGDKNILSKDEYEGYLLFKDLGCISCHNGINIGGNLYQKMGIIKEYKTEDNNLGRYNVTKYEHDKYFFKVPTLRNIEYTAPYFHDGRVSTLEAAIKIMLEYQVGLEISSEDIHKVELFLKSLNGEIPSLRLDTNE